MLLILFFHVLFPNFYTANFTADGFRKLCDKFHNPGVFLRRSIFLYVVLDFLLQCVAAFFAFYQNNGSFDDLSPHRIWHRCDGTFQHVRQLHDHAFDFKGADSVSGGFDYIVCTSHIPDISLFILPGSVTCVVIPIMPCFFCIFFVPIISQEQSGCLLYTSRCV